MSNQALSLILRELDAMDAGDAVREQLAAFAAKGDVYPALFRGAGPADDGTIDAARVAENAARLCGPDELEEKLGPWLYDYASYALFLARPLLHREKDAKPQEAGDPSPTKRLSQRVSAVLEPIAPTGSKPRIPKPTP